MDNPIPYFLAAQEAKNRNAQQSYQDLAGIGQSLGQGFNALGQAAQERKKQQVLQQLVAAMQAQGKPMVGPLPPTMGAPIQGPQGYVPPGAGPSAVPAGQRPMFPTPESERPNIDNRGQIEGLMTRLNPSLGIEAYMQGRKMQQGKQSSPWRVVSGMLSKDGKPIQQNEISGEVRTVDLNAVPNNAAGNGMAAVRQKIATLNALPSNQSANTAGGAAYQVKVAARQGMNLIAKPGPPQRTAIAQADLVRAVTRVAPTDEGMKNANFSNNLVTRWATLKQKITANPELVDNPKIRKEMYDIFKEMDDSATPFVKMQLDNANDIGLTSPGSVYKREMGGSLPPIPFFESNPLNSQFGSKGTPMVDGMLHGQKITKVEPWQNIK